MALSVEQKAQNVNLYFRRRLPKRRFLWSRPSEIKQLDFKNSSSFIPSSHIRTNDTILIKPLANKKAV